MPTQNSQPTVRDRVRASLAPGKWYTFPEIMRLVGTTRGTLECAMEQLSRDGEVYTARDETNRNRRSYRLTTDRALSTTSRGRTRDGRELLAAELVPVGKITTHPCVVGPLDTWRGLMWEDMPGQGELNKKCNFALWRRGLLRYDLLPTHKKR